MKMISSQVHGILDYVVSVILIASPWLFGFHNEGAQTIIPVGLGITTILYSLVTRYEYSVAKVLLFSTHLIIDGVSGVFLLVSPWIFNFHNEVYLPHVIFGVLELTVVALTSKRRGKKL